MAKPSDAHWFSQVKDPLVLEDPEPSDWDDTADLVIVGFGGAGACAAIEGVRGGARVIVLDRFQGGGATAMSGGVVYAGGGTRLQQENGVKDDAEQMYRYLSIETQGVVSDATLREFCNGSVEQLEWLEQLGLEFRGDLSPVKTSYPYKPYFLYYSGNEGLPENAEQARPAPRGHRQRAKGQAGLELYGHLKAAALRAGVVPCLQTQVERLVVDSHGRVIGGEGMQLIPGTRESKRHARLSNFLARRRGMGTSIASRIVPRMERLEKAGRRRRRIRARRGVILATGGYVRNRDMFRYYLPKYSRGMANGSPGCDGSGIRLGESVGGVASLMDHASAWRFINPPEAFAHGIIVDAKGERFCNEGAYGAQIGYFMCEQHDGRAWLVLDKQLFRKARKQCGPRAQAWFFQTLLALITMYANSKNGATLEELAQACGMQADTLRHSVETYGEAAAGRIEDPFRKDPALLQALGPGPYFALDISLRNKTLPCAVITFGGLAVDDRSGRVERADGSTIPGLWAVGRTAVGIPSNNYVSGLAIADCVFTGRRAARSALEIT